ncbi:MAG: cellulase family glycosylhydrolase, partial [Ruminiclostridium sp.]|nr:cellulase family glycosylhydrolase [Ruminiclostridium sp.]
MKIKNIFLSLALSASILLSGCSSETTVSDLEQTSASVSVIETETEQSIGTPAQSTVPSPEIGSPTSENNEQTLNSSESSAETILTEPAVFTSDTNESEPATVTSTVSASNSEITTAKPAITAIKPTVTETKPAVTTTKPEVTTTQPVVTSSKPAKPDVPAEKVGFYVNGTNLYDINGNRFVMRGINHAHTWFKNQLNTAVPAIADTGANTIRIVLSDGQQWTKDPASSVKNIIELCKKNDLICILEVHDITGGNDIKGLQRVTDYWIEIKDALVGNEPYVILNIANEWVGNWDAEIWYKGYSEAVKRLRDAGLRHTIMIDAAGWGQYGASIGQYGKKLLQEDTCGNLMFSVHMYGTAGGNPDSIRRNLKYATDNGLCVIVGEFGYYHSDGDVDEK